MSPETFDHLLEHVRIYITKQDTVMRRSIPPEERLAVTLRYIATGDSYESLSFSYRIAASTISLLVPETCNAIWRALLPKVMPAPDGNQWTKIAADFGRIWQFPNCLGSIDGRHISIQAPGNTGSRFFNYKKSFSMVLLAVADAKYRFVMVDIGAFGRQSDGGVFAKSNFGKSFISGGLSIPHDAPLVLDGPNFPHVFVGDEAFPLKRNLMRPYGGPGQPRAERIFNYRLSRARRVIANAFGIMSSRFRIFCKGPILLKPSGVDSIIKACTVLHNFLSREPAYTNPDDKVPPEITESVLLPLTRVGRPSSSVAMAARDRFRDYFIGEGSLPWQNEYVFRTS